MSALTIRGAGDPAVPAHVSPEVALEVARALPAPDAPPILQLPDLAALGRVQDRIARSGTGPWPQLVAPWHSADEPLPGPGGLDLWLGGVPDPGAPVAFLEPAYLGRDAVVPAGTAAPRRGDAATLRHPASRLLLVGHAGSAEFAEHLRMAGGEGLGRLELHRLSPVPVDAVVEALKDCGRMIFVQAGAGDAALADRLIAELVRSAFEWLDAPPQRVSAADPDDARRVLAALLEY